MKFHGSQRICFVTWWKQLLSASYVSWTIDMMCRCNREWETIMVDISYLISSSICHSYLAKGADLCLDKHEAMEISASDWTIWKNVLLIHLPGQITQSQQLMKCHYSWIWNREVVLRVEQHLWLIWGPSNMGRQFKMIKEKWRLSNRVYHFRGDGFLKEYATWWFSFKVISY